MNDVILRAEQLSKVFKLYSKPHYRFLDMLGLLRQSGAYQEFWAIKDLDLVIHKGEKVAFIGRNGAGKSTLLRLITGVTQPSAGKLEVSQGVHALLQIGTGFHPDFTGRENALAYLAHLGVTGQAAELKLKYIIEFSELEEYINQPVKTYSSGMMARLMFATSTAIAPELLVLDEILGVGDAYFANKSFERIMEMSVEDKTTVILVSHDVYSAAKLCSRMIWLDKGLILLDGPSAEVIKAYDHSIRIQEESRLRAKAAAMQKQGIQDQAIIEISIKQNKPLKGELLLCAVRVLDKINPDLEYLLSSTEHAFVPPSGYKEIEGKQGQLVLGDSASLNRMRLFVELSTSQLNLIERGNVSLQMDFFASETNEIAWEIWHKGKCLARAYVLMQSREVTDVIYDERERSLTCNAWDTVTVTLKKPTAQLEEQPDTCGSGRVWVEDLQLLDGAGNPKFVFNSHESLELCCRYHTPPNNGKKIEVEFLIGFHREGVTDVARLISSPVTLSDGHEGQLTFKWKGWHFGQGRYTLTLMAVKPGYYDNNNGKFYSINNDVYYVLNRGIEFIMQGGGNRYLGTSVVGSMNLSILETAPVCQMVEELCD